MADISKIKLPNGNEYDIKDTTARTQDTNHYNEIISRGEQLVVNGNGFMGDNTNFSLLTFDGSKSNGSPGSFTMASTVYTTVISDYFFPVNPSLRYRISFDAISENGLARFYSFANFYDVDKNAIWAYNHMYYPNTLTTLTQDLKAGDTVVHLSSVANYHTYGSSSHQRALIFWDYKNSYGYQYPPETYSKYVLMPAWTNDSSINTTNNTITLSTAYTGVTHKAGTYVSQGNSGGSYKYVGALASIIPTTWKSYSGYYDGTDYSGANVYTKFPPATAYAKFGLLWNDQSVNDHVWVTNLSFYSVSPSADIITSLGYTPSHQVSLGNQPDYQRCVIALCETSANNTGIDSWSNVIIMRRRNNGYVTSNVAYASFNGSYTGAYSAHYSLLCNKENYSTEARGTTEGFRACSFTYNNKRYAGLEFYQTQSCDFYYNYGGGNFTPFMVPYYNTQTSTVINSEINNSLVYGTSILYRQPFESQKVNGHTVNKDVPSDAVFTDTKVTAVGNHYTPSGGTTTSASGATGTSGTTVQVVTGITKDSAGHVTGITSGAATDTTYESKTAASGGTAVSLVTTGEKYTWNNKSTVPTNHASTATTYGAGSSSNYGHVKLSSSTSSTSAESGGIAATPSAVKTAYDLANSANTKANTVESGLNGTLIYDHTYSISNGVATFTPHVYLKGTEVTTNYAASCFKWYYRTIDGAQVQITTASDRTCTVTITQHGYGGHVIGTFTPA